MPTIPHRRLGALLLLLPLLAAVPAPARAQTIALEDPVLRVIWEQVRDSSRVERLAQVLLDSIGPRLTGSPEMDRAQEWALERFRAWGIDARLEEYGTWLGWRRGPSHIDLVAPRVRSLEGRILAWSPGTDGRPVEGPVVALPQIRSPADWEAFLRNVRGHWVMMSFPEPTCRADDQWLEFAMEGSYERMASEREEGRALWEEALAATGSTDPRRRDLHRQLEAAGALGIVTSQWPGSYGTTRVFNAYTREVPTFELSCEDYGLVYRLAANTQNPVLRLTAEAEYLGERPVHNVIATIPGTELPDEYVLLSAHFDSWEGGSGATDNGTGSILMMEAARILREVLPAPRRTILVALWNGEEQGLNGSRAFTEDHPEVVEGLQALFNQDNGTGRIVRISPQGFPEAAETLAGWLARVPEEVSRHVELELPGSPGSGGSDYASFVCWGAPGFNLGALSWDYGTHTWHTHRDTFDKVVMDDLRNNVVLTASLAYLAANAEERVSRKRRDVLTDGRGQAVSWPECQPAVRRTADSPRMER